MNADKEISKAFSEFSVLPYRDELRIGQGRLYIDGRWRDASDAATMAHLHPTTNEAVAQFAVASAQDVDEAVRAARRAFETGPRRAAISSIRPCSRMSTTR